VLRRGGGGGGVRIKKIKLETKILGVQHGEIPLLLPDLLKDKGRLTA